MPAPKDPAADFAETGLRWPMLVITGLLAVAVAFILVPSEPFDLKMLARRRAEIISDPFTRDIYPSIAYFRELDTKLSPDTRIFFSGMIGEDKVRRIYYYYFARTCLFPRDMEISLDHQAKFYDWFAGVDCNSPEQLRTDGYDVMLSLEKNGKVTVLPLTEKGKLKP